MWRGAFCAHKPYIFSHAGLHILISASIMTPWATYNTSPLDSHLLKGIITSISYVLHYKSKCLYTNIYIISNDDFIPQITKQLQDLFKHVLFQLTITSRMNDSMMWWLADTSSTKVSGQNMMITSTKWYDSSVLKLAWDILLVLNLFVRW